MEILVFSQIVRSRWRKWSKNRGGENGMIFPGGENGISPNIDRLWVLNQMVQKTQSGRSAKLKGLNNENRTVI